MHANFFQWINVNDFRSILCLNGHLPDKSFFEQCPIRPVIAVDGSANQLMQNTLTFDVLIGDLDSVNVVINPTIQVLELKHQSQSDFEKSIDFSTQNELFPAIILGINGGYLDHILNNVSLFSQLDCIFYAPPIMGMMIHPQKPFSMRLPKHTKISLMAMPHAVLNSKGLIWELEQMTLNFPGQSSCFNRTVSNIVNIDVIEGLVLALIYTQPIDDGANFFLK